LSLLPSLMERLLGEARELSGRFGRLDLAAHLGWGVLRVGFPRVPAGDGERMALAGALRELRGRLEAAGGGLVVSQGPAGLLKEVGSRGEGGGEASLMRGLKEEFDPAGILSPGRFRG